MIAPDQRCEIARLFSFLMQGERLARDCALRQASIAPDRAARHTLLAQVRQEGFHARVFQSAIGWLAPKGVSAPPGLEVMERYCRLITKALDRGEVAESLLAQQVILEGLGHVVLSCIDRGMSRRALGFSHLRRILLYQEKAHHGFGVRELQRLLDQRAIAPEGFRQRAQDYLTLTDSMLALLSDFFEFFDEDPADYARELRHHLPGWIGLI